MDKQGYVHKRKKRYMAQTLDEFEREIQSYLPPDKAESFKRTVRRKMNALAVDAAEIINLKPGEELNGAVVELRDQLHVEGRPIQRSEST